VVSVAVVLDPSSVLGVSGTLKFGTIEHIFND
jgi:hypothetical protein